MSVLYFNRSILNRYFIAVKLLKKTEVNAHISDCFNRFLKNKEAVPNMDLNNY